jgi:hypothetical protein
MLDPKVAKALKRTWPNFCRKIYSGPIQRIDEIVLARDMLAQVVLATTLGPLRRFVLAHPNLLILEARMFCFSPIYKDPSSRLWECGNRASDFQGLWEEGKTCFWFSRLSTARHFHSCPYAVFTPFFFSVVRRNR